MDRGNHRQSGRREIHQIGLVHVAAHHAGGVPERDRLPFHAVQPAEKLLQSLVIVPAGPDHHPVVAVPSDLRVVPHRGLGLGAPPAQLLEGQAVVFREAGQAGVGDEGDTHGNRIQPAPIGGAGSMAQRLRGLRLSLAAVRYTGPETSRIAGVVAALRGTVAIVINRDLIALRLPAESPGLFREACDGHCEDGQSGGDGKANLGSHWDLLIQVPPLVDPSVDGTLEAVYLEVRDRRENLVTLRASTASFSPRPRMRPSARSTASPPPSAGRPPLPPCPGRRWRPPRGPSRRSAAPSPGNSFRSARAGGPPRPAPWRGRSSPARASWDRSARGTARSAAGGPPGRRARGRWARSRRPPRPGSA